MSDTTSRIVLITGASSGFGLLTSLTLAKENHHVIATVRSEQKRDELMRKAQEAGVIANLDVRLLEVTDFSAIPSLVASLIQDYGRIDVLINNAGFASGGFIEDITLSSWQEQFNTNFFGVVALSKAVLPSMRNQNKGLIINISSVSAMLGFPGMGPYSASKFAVEGFSEALRLEMKPYQVDVVLIEPASYKTGIWSTGLERSTLRDDSAYKKRIDGLRQDVETIARTSGDPSEVAALIQRIIRARKPKLRYPIGKGARSLSLAKRLLPFSLFEYFLTKNQSAK